MFQRRRIYERCSWVSLLLLLAASAHGYQVCDEFSVQLQATFDNSTLIPCSSQETTIIEALLHALVQTDVIVGLNGMPIRNFFFAFDTLGPGANWTTGDEDEISPLSQYDQAFPYLTDEDVLEDMYYEFEVPSGSPSMMPSGSPSLSPSISPSALPSLSPSASPSVSPTESSHPSASPSIAPSLSPSIAPSSNPSETPSIAPSLSPSFQPSLGPSASPSIAPSLNPSDAPSLGPSLSPSIAPSAMPTTSPSPSSSPSASPSLSPSTSPSSRPSFSPSISPSEGPTIDPNNRNGVDTNVTGTSVDKTNTNGQPDGPLPTVGLFEDSLRSGAGLLNNQYDKTIQGGGGVRRRLDASCDGADWCATFLSEPCQALPAPDPLQQSQPVVYQAKIDAFQERVAKAIEKKLRKWARDTDCMCLGNSWELKAIVTKLG